MVIVVGPGYAGYDPYYPYYDGGDGVAYGDTGYGDIGYGDTGYGDVPAVPGTVGAEELLPDADGWDDADRRIGRADVLEGRPAPRPDAAALVAEPVGDGALRVSWRGGSAAGGRVTLVVADAARRVLATRGVRAWPFTAVFPRAARVAFVGVTVVQADGGSTTALVPIATARARRD